MPIEPSSVSKPVIREVEKVSSGSGQWNAAQGSSTGGKDSPLHSIWEKAISGAQRLFGRESAKPEAVEDPTEKDEERRADNRQESLNTTSSFATRNYARVGFHSSPGSAFSNVSSTPSRNVDVRPDYEPAPDAGREADKAHFVEKPDRSQATENPKERPEVDEPHEDEGEDGDERARQLRATVQPIPSPNSISPLVASNREVAQPAQAAETSTPATNISAQTTQADQTPTTPNVPVTVGQTVPSVATQQTPAALASVPEGVAQSTIQPALQNLVTNSRQAGQPNPQPVSPTPQQTVAQATTGPVVSPATGTTSPVTAQDTAGSRKLPNQAGQEQAPGRSETQAPKTVETESLLGIDPAKAKETITAALSRSQKSTPQTPIQAQPAPTATPAAQPVGAEPVEPAIRSALNEAAANGRLADVSVDGKELAQTAANKAGNAANATANLRQAAAEAATAATRSSGEPASENAAVASQKAQAAQASASSVREARAATVGPVPVAAQNRGPAPTNAGATTATGPAALGQTQGATGISSPNTQGGSQNQTSDGALKQDLSAQLKGSQGSERMEKSSSDTSQAFDLKAQSSDSSRKSQAAGKAQTTSYVSKTVEEMKEVVATMTKSIDRLVTNRGGAMNLKINFDNGGSMTLRVSMEGAQVSTNMQTDVAGLEAAIKANWTDFASEWSQKGVKLNVPYFQSSASGENAFENLADSGQRQPGTQGSAGQGGRRSSAGASGSNQSPSSAETAASQSTDTSSSDEVISDSELKTYA